MLSRLRSPLRLDLDCASGRIVAAFVMLEGADSAIVTAGITSTFVARVQNERGLAEAAARRSNVSTCASTEMSEWLDRIETMLSRLEGPS